MANNLVSLVMQFLTPDMIGRIAAALGLDRNKAQTAINAAVPGLLAALGCAAAQPGGAQKLADAARQQTGTLEDLARMLGTGGHGSLADKGSQMLSSLLGPNKDAIAGAVSKFAGLGQGSGGSLLGMLAPAIMGTIAKQQGGRSLDASGIASLFAGQKDNIAAALPTGFGKLLAGTGLLDSLGGAARAATSTATQTVQAAARDRRRAHLLLRQIDGASGQGGGNNRTDPDRWRSRYRQASRRRHSRPAHCARERHRCGFRAVSAAEDSRDIGADR